MTNPYQSPEPTSPRPEHDAEVLPVKSDKRMRRIGYLLIELGLVGIFSGMLFTLYQMVQTFVVIVESPAPRPAELAEGVSSAVSTATIATAGGGLIAAVLIPVGVVLMVKAGRRHRTKGNNSSGRPDG